ncbi:MAG: M16 family metallopeptidase, partial [Bacteroidia bacterium]
EGVQSIRKNPSAMSDIAFNRILFKGTLLEEPSFGSFKTVKKIELSDVKDYYTKFYSPSVSSVVVSGDITQEEVTAKLSFLKNWTNKPVTLPSLGTLPTFDKVQIYLIDKPYAPQSVVTVAANHLPYDYNGDYFKTNVMYFPLGGNFNSRLTMNIREEHGFAYSPQSAFYGNKYFGNYFWQADVRTNATDSAIHEVMKEITNYKKNGITDEELAFTKSSLILSDALRYESPGQKASFLSRIVTYKLPNNYVAEQINIIERLTKQDIDAIAQKTLHPETITIIVVGHAYKIRDGLNKLGYGKVKEITLD